MGDSTVNQSSVSALEEVPRVRENRTYYQLKPYWLIFLFTQVIYMRRAA